MAETEIKKINGRTLCDNQARTDINKVQQELDSMVFNETDPTVPEWAKASTKPTYTAEEVGALPSTTKIPSKTSDLTNDSGFLTYIPSIYVTEEELEAKHYLTSVPDHYVTKIDLDNRGYLTESDIEVELDQFITEDEVEATIEGEVSAVKDELQGEIEQGLESHNTDTEAHNDIRLLIEGLTTRLNTLADSDDTTLDQMSELVAYIKDNRELIEGVTTDKVNVSDIIDNLTTNVANKPLSAAQGVALKTLIDALQTALNNHTSDGTAHITAAERTSWNGKVNQTDFNKFSEQTQQAVDEIVDAVLDLREKGGTPHDHSWDEVGIEHYDTGGDTTTSDDVIYDAYHKVSECIPTYEDLQDGCSISYYSVSDGAITGELQTVNFPEGDYTISESTNGVLFMADGIPMVLISYNGNPEFGAVTFSAITEAGVYFAQGNNNMCIHSLTVNGYTGFPNTVLEKLPYERLPDEYEEFYDWTHQAVDEIVDFVSEPDKTERAFKFISNDTLSWNGDTESKIVATYNGETRYIRVSSAVPTLEDLQNGGYCVWNDSDEPYPFVSEDVVESDDYIIPEQYYSIFIAKTDYVDYNGLVFPKQGIYFAYDTSERHCESLTINDYTGFTKPILKIDSLPSHGHDWYGKVVKAGNTVLNDNTQTGTYVKVSDAVPTEAELRKGGVVRYYAAVDGVMSDELTIGNYLESPYDMSVFNNGITINIGFEFPVIISFNGNPKFGALTFNGVTEPGVYFCQGEYTHTHSLTINEYTGFSSNVEKVPAELLPESGGVSSWNDLTDKPFGETTTTSDTLTWDGDMTGKVYVQTELPIDEDGNTTTLYVVKVSDSTPTMEDLQDGGTISAGSQSIPFPDGEEPADLGNAIMIGQYVGIVKEDNTDLTDVMGIVLPEKGVYFVSMPAMGMFIESFTINNYQFEITDIKTLNTKYLPKSHQFGEKIVKGDTLTWDGDMTGKPVVTLDMGDGQVTNFCKVSDAVPTLEDFSDGVSVTLPGMGTQEVTADVVAVGDGYIFASAAAIISKPNTLIDGVGATFPETGIWLVNQSGRYISELKINGYTGFETTTIKKIDPKYVEVPSSGGILSKSTDTLEWDGNVEGRFILESDLLGKLVHISDVVPTIGDLMKGGTVITWSGNGGIEEETFSEADIINNSGFYLVNNFLIVPEPITIYGESIPKTGIYSSVRGLSIDDLNYIPLSLQINEYDKFKKNVLENSPCIPYVKTINGVGPDARGNVVPDFPRLMRIHFYETEEEGVYATDASALEAEEVINKGGLLYATFNEYDDFTQYYMLTQCNRSNSGAITALNFTRATWGSKYDVITWNIEEDTIERISNNN